MPDVTTTGVIMGLLLALVAARWMTTSRRPGMSVPKLWLLAISPSVMVLASFVADDSMRGWFTGLVPLLMIGFFSAAALLVDGAQRCPDGNPSALSVRGTIALFAVLGALFTLGCLVQVRLRFQKDPTAKAAAGVDNSSVADFLVSQALLPLGMLALGVLFVRVWPSSRPHWLRVVEWAECHMVGFPPFSRMVPDGRPGAHPSQRRRVPLVGLVTATIFVLALAALPLGWPATNEAHLYAFGRMLAVNEWVRPLWALLVAATLACVFYEVGEQRWLRIRGRALLLAGLLASQVIGIVVIAGLRSDMGSLISLAPMAAVMALPAGRWNRNRLLVAVGTRPSVIATRSGWWIFASSTLAAGLLLTVMFFAGPGYKSRVEPWKDPWQFPWSPARSSVETPPSWVRPVSDQTVPAGHELSLVVQKDALNANKSQMARALTAIDGGGLWGRGLSDTEAHIVPLNDTDLVLAAIWSKLGGVVVVLATLSAIAMSLLAIRSISPIPLGVVPGSTLSVLQLYRYAIGTAIASHAIFLVLATTNQVPFSGIPFPFLAHGGQASGGFMLGLVAAIVLTSWQPSRPLRTAARRAKADPSRALLLAIMVLVCLWALVAGLLLPFASLQQRRIDAGLAQPDVQTQLRARGTPAQLSIAGKSVYEQDRVTGAWTVAEDTPAPVATDDLFGVLRNRSAGTQGMVDSLAGGFLAPTESRTLSDRLAQTAQATPQIDLTLEPAMQTAVARAVRAPLEGSSRFASGVVVLNASTGEVQALSSAPDEREVLHDVASAETVRAWNKANGGWGPLTADKTTIDAPSPVCTGNVKCGRLVLQKRTPSLDTEYLRSYVGGDPAFTLPSTSTNRAAGRRYNLGSTFKVVLAAAYFEAGGSATDRISAPPLVMVGNRRFDQKCPGTVKGMITVADALRVSCNNAFITLARHLKWSQVVSVAERLGFTAVEDSGASDSTAWPVASHIPRQVDQHSAGSAAIGGDVVAGTPFQIAAMMGAIAHDGTYIEPYVISRTRSADGEVSSHQPIQRPALKPSTVANLRAAMSEVTGEGGTLANVEVPAGVRFQGKSGTSLPRELTTSGTYTTHYSWVSGIAESATDDRDPIAFSVVVEGHGPDVGGRQARRIAAAILQSFANR